MSNNIKDDTKPKIGKKKDSAGGSDSNGAPAETVPTSSGLLIWLVVFLAIIGVGGWAFWPETGPSVKTIIAKVRGISKPEDMAPPSSLDTSKPDTAKPVASVVVEAQPPAPAPAPTPTPEPALEPEPELTLTPTPEPTPAPTPAPARDFADASAFAMAMANIQNRLSQIEKRLGELENRPQLTRDPASSAQVLVLATTQLATRLGGEGSFQAELDVLEKVSGQSEIVIGAVKELRPHAGTGIPTIATLRARFVDLSRDIMRARLKDGESGWMGKIKNKLGSLVTIRRTDPATTTDPTQRALALADAALDVGALDEAVRAVGSIEGDAGVVAAPWLGDASARLLAQGTLEALHNYALSQLGGQN